MDRIKKTVFILMIMLITLAGCQATETKSPKPENTQKEELDNTRWQLKTYLNAQGKVVNILPGTKVTIEFKSGNASGTASCNTYNASYELDGKTLSFGTSMSTMKMCPEPKGIMEQESEYLAALALTNTYQIEDDQLKLFDASGEEVLVYNKVGSEENAGLANPASVHCYEQGGKLEMRTDSEGGQVGYCIFEDGSECEEWAFFNGECKPGSSD